VSLTGGPVSPLLANSAPANAPGFGLTVFTIVLPIGLMLLATLADVTLAKDNRVRAWLGFAGHPLVAMTAAFLFSCWSFGAARGFDREQLLKFTNDCVGPVGSMLLIVGAGGGFNGVLVASGVGDAMAAQVKDAPVSPLLLGWLAAALIRVATGSATVAITTAAGILAPIVAAKPGVNLELLVLSMGAGSLILSHVNDGGFWFVKEYFNLTVPQTLKTWTVMETIIAFVALGLVLLLDQLL
jgi:GntP family gluconate:H+ symporter